MLGKCGLQDCATPTGIEFKAKWHVGDTPMDIQAAEGGHAKALGVLTGVYSQQDLEECGAGNMPAPFSCVIAYVIAVDQLSICNQCIAQDIPFDKS